MLRRNDALSFTDDDTLLADGGDSEFLACSPLHKALIVEQYVRRLPLGVMFVSPEGALIFDTQEGQRKCARWNRALRGAAQRSWSLPCSIPELIAQAETSPRAYRRDVRGAAIWHIGHPQLQDLQVRLETCYGKSSPRRVIGYSLTFVERTSQAAPRAKTSAKAMALMQELSPRERQVASLAAQGLSNQAISDRLIRSIRTVEFQLNSIYKKLRLRNRTQLVLALAA